MASTEALFDHRAGCVQEVPDAATRCRSVHTPLQLVAGGRYELYSAYPIRVPAVPASVSATR